MAVVWGTLLVRYLLMYVCTCLISSTALDHVLHMQLSFTVHHLGTRGVMSVMAEIVLVDVPTSTPSGGTLGQQLTVK